MQLKIVKDTDPKLREKSIEVPTPLSKENQELIDEMLHFLKLSQDEEYRAKHPSVREGVGLAAPQIGHNVKMIVISYPTGDPEQPLVEYQLVNPKIIVNSLKKVYLREGEGCLSVDEKHPGHVMRDYKIKVKAYDAKSKQDIEITARGYDAIVLQHEIDHLSGILFYDRINKKDPFEEPFNSVGI